MSEFVRNIGGMMVTGETRSTCRKNCPSVTFFHLKSNMDKSGVELYFGGSLLATTPEVWHGSAKWNFNCLIKTVITASLLSYYHFILQTVFANNFIDAFLSM
jgi:hypothetical protein